MISDSISRAFLQPVQPVAPMAAPQAVTFAPPPQLLQAPPEQPAGQMGGQQGGGTDAIMKLITQLFASGGM